MIEHLSHWTSWVTTTSYPYGQNRGRLGPKRNRSGPTTWPPSTPGSLHSQVALPGAGKLKNKEPEKSTSHRLHQLSGVERKHCDRGLKLGTNDACVGFWGVGPWRADRHGAINPCVDLYASRADHEELVPRAVVAAAPGVCTDEGFPKRSALDASSGP